MSDYMFMLESHLSPEQFQAVRAVAAAAEVTGLPAFLTGGAMRDMLGGYPVRDIDFTAEGNVQKLVKHLTQKSGCKQIGADDARKSVELRFPSGVTAEVSQAHTSKYARPGAKPEAKASTIHDDLCGRDFTINSIALSLNKGSMGLLIDPTNGLGDLQTRELRANGNYALYDDPSRILRMFRLRARLGFELAERTRTQYENVREAKLEQKIPSRALLEELRRLADEPNPEAVLETLDKEGLLVLFLPTLTGSKLDLSGFSKLQKARQLVPYGAGFRSENFGLLLYLLTAKLSPKEKAQLIKHVGLNKGDVNAWQKLEARAKKLETRIKSPKLKKASMIYKLLKESPGEETLFLMVRSSQRLVHDRIRNYLQKYLPMAEEVTEKDLGETTLVTGSPKFKAALEALIVAKLDGRVRKPAPEPPPPPAPAAPPPRGPVPPRSSIVIAARR
ncbi:MAG: hypothetical protein U0Q16_19620 [Bryobacteraceae bacterium]